MYTDFTVASQISRGLRKQWDLRFRIYMSVHTYIQYQIQKGLGFEPSPFILDWEPLFWNGWIRSWYIFMLLNLISKNYIRDVNKTFFTMSEWQNPKSCTISVKLLLQCSFPKHSVPICILYACLPNSCVDCHLIHNFTNLKVLNSFWPLSGSYEN